MRASSQKQNQAQKPVSSSLARPNLATPEPGHRKHQMRHLQRTIGNQTMQRLLQVNTEGLKVESDTIRFAQDFSRMPVRATVPVKAQAKLKVSTPGDRYEEEADRVADQVMRMPDSQLQRTCACGGECTQCQAEQTGQEHPLVQTKADQTSEDGGGTAPPIVDEILQSSGHPLDAATRNYFEPRFGHSFHHVRVHADDNAAVSAHSVEAKAYTVGHHIVFGAGQYAPGSSEGQRLLAHELTHVIQQGGRSGVRGDGSAHLFRACLPAAICSAPLHGCVSGTGSASDFSADQASRELRSRQRRRGMATPRQRSTGHLGHARQLEIFLAREAPSVLAGLHGIFIDQDVARDTWGYVLDPPCEVDPADARQQIPGAVRPCVFIHDVLNQQALLFNTTTAATAPVIGTMSREDWRIDTIAGFTHELQHTLFNPATVPTPAGVACVRSGPVDFELSEINAILVEFHVVSQAVAANPNAAERARLMRNWFTHAITSCGESLAGTLKKLRCLCNCPDVDAFVRETFNFVSSGWAPAERGVFNTEMHEPRWLPWDLRWPLP